MYKNHENKGKTKQSHTQMLQKTSEKISQPAAPLAIGAQIKEIAKTHSKVSGKKNWLVDHSMDLTIGIGFIWGIGKVFYFFYPDRWWTYWVTVTDAFFPISIITLAIIFRFYDKIDFFKHRE